MQPSPRSIQSVYLVLVLLNTLAASLIWGINTLFLLDAGLSNAQAFLANAFFTIGQVLFEVPTGMVADTKGRKTSYLLGTLTLSLSTIVYVWAWYVQAHFGIWALSSMLLGLGFTFFSGATEAWLVDALTFAGFDGKTEDVFARGQMVGGVAMLFGSVSGGLIAQFTNLGVPYLVRAALLVLTFGVALVFMKDWGFTPEERTTVMADLKKLFIHSASFGWRNPAVGWMMVAAPFASGVGFYTFYAMQPYLLNLYGDQEAYLVAGLAAAIVAGAQIAGGMVVPYLRRFFVLRTTVLVVGTMSAVSILFLLGVIPIFSVAILLLCGWGLVFAATQPVRQAYLNGLIPSKQRATILSFDTMMASGGGVVFQPILGKTADVFGYGFSFALGAAIQSLAVPFIIFSQRQQPASDHVSEI